MVALLRRMIAQQDKTNNLLQELIQQGRLQQQAQQTELERWKQSQPEWLLKQWKFKRRQNEFLQSRPIRRENIPS